MIHIKTLNFGVFQAKILANNLCLPRHTFRTQKIFLGSANEKFLVQSKIIIIIYKLLKTDILATLETRNLYLIGVVLILFIVVVTKFLSKLIKQNFLKLTKKRKK